jgi:hypothetical protein
MNRRVFPWLLVAVVLSLQWACNRPVERVSPDVEEIVKTLQAQWDVIDEKTRDIERRRSLLYEDNKKQLEEIQKQIESIQSELEKMRAQLDAMRTTPSTAVAEPRRLPIEVSVVLLIVIVFCLLLALKLRSVRMRETTLSPPEEAARETETENENETNESSAP